MGVATLTAPAARYILFLLAVIADLLQIAPRVASFPEEGAGADGAGGARARDERQQDVLRDAPGMQPGTLFLLRGVN